MRERTLVGLVAALAASCVSQIVRITRNCHPGRISY